MSAQTVMSLSLKYVLFRSFTISFVATNGLRCIPHRRQYISYIAEHLFSPLTILYCFYINGLVCRFLSYFRAQSFAPRTTELCILAIQPNPTQMYLSRRF